MSDPDHTAVRLVASAERLFAESGEEATSLRAITREARSNAAAVHYHFGGRDELLRAVLDQYLGPLAAERARLLDDAASRHGERVPVPVIIEAVVRPDLELLARLRSDRVQVARFLGRAHTLPTPAVAELVARRFAELVEQAMPLLRPAVPAVADEELRLRLRLVRASVVYAFAAAPDPGPDGPLGDNDVDEQVRRLVAFAAAGISAKGAASTARTGPDGYTGNIDHAGTGDGAQTVDNGATVKPVVTARKARQSQEKAATAKPGTTAKRETLAEAGTPAKRTSSTKADKAKAPDRVETGKGEKRRKKR